MSKKLLSVLFAAVLTVCLCAVALADAPQTIQFHNQDIVVDLTFLDVIGEVNATQMDKDSEDYPIFLGGETPIDVYELTVPLYSIMSTSFNVPPPPETGQGGMSPYLHLVMDSEGNYIYFTLGGADSDLLDMRLKAAEASGDEQEIIYAADLVEGLKNRIAKNVDLTNIISEDTGEQYTVAEYELRRTGTYTIFYFSMDIEKATPIAIRLNIIDTGKSPLPIRAEYSTPLIYVNDNDEFTPFYAYNIDDNDYFKLRDFAHIFNGGEKQFSIEWDGAANSIILTSGQPYTDVGGEMAFNGLERKTPVEITAKIFLDGGEVPFSAYTIDGHNYFKLRDIARALDFNISYRANHIIVINTTESYTAD